MSETPAPAPPRLFEDDKLHEMTQRFFNETIEAMELAKASPDLNDLAAVLAAAYFKIGHAIGYVNARYPGFENEVRETLKYVHDAQIRESQSPTH